MGNARHAVLVRLLLLAAAIAPLRGASYLSRFWQTGDGLPSNVVSGTARDEQGFLWIATGAGVARFDGVRFELHSLAEGLPDTQVHSLHLDRQGRLWAGTRRGAAYRENGRWHPVADLPAEAIYTIGEAKDGAIWFGTFRACWRRADGKSAQVDLGDIPADTRSFLDDGYGGLWILTRGHLCRWSPDKPREAEPVAGPWSGYELRDLCRDAAGRIVLAGTGLLLRESDGGWENLGDTLPGGRNRAYLACAATPDGDLWLTTRDRGVLCLHEGQWTALDARGPLTLDDVRNVLIDDDGLVWLGTNGGGLNLLRRRLFDSYSTDEGLGRTVTSALVIDRDGGVWAGTDGGGIRQLRGDRFGPAFQDAGLPESGLIWSLCAARDGSLWAGTFNEGLWRIEDGRATAIPLGTPEKRMVSSLHEARDGAMIAGVELAGLRRWQDGRLDPEFIGPEEKDIFFHDTLEDRHGNTWAACGSHGLWRRSGGTWSRIGDEPGKDVLNPAALLESATGDLWIGTLGQGLLRHRDGAFTAWDTADGLVSDSVVQLLEDETGSLWLGTDTGMQRVTIAELESGARFSGLRLGREDGLPTPQFSGEHGNLCAKAADGTLWFSLASGAIHLDPRDFAKARRPATVRIESATTDRGTLWERGGSALITVAPGSGTLRIRFASPEFIAPERVRFRCRMEGLEKEWQEIEGARTVSYAALPPGDYRFNLMVAGRDGSWSEKAVTIDIRQAPYFWQRLGFQAAATVAAASLLGFIVYKWSRRRLRRKVEALRQERRVELERARIARDLHDDLGARLTEINFLGTLAGGAMADGPPRDKVFGMVERARGMAKSLDEIVWTVNPDNDTLESTVPYLCARVRESLAAAGIRCRLDVDESAPRCTLDSQRRHHLLMTVNEIVNNAMKHSGASEVALTVRIAGDRLTVEIADNGKGFDPAVAEDSERNGLRNLQRRMEAAGGRFSLHSGPAGTVATLELPLSSP